MSFISNHICTRLARDGLVAHMKQTSIVEGARFTAYDGPYPKLLTCRFCRASCRLGSTTSTGLAPSRGVVVCITSGCLQPINLYIVGIPACGSSSPLPVERSVPQFPHCHEAECRFLYCWWLLCVS